MNSATSSAVLDDEDVELAALAAAIAEADADSRHNTHEDMQAWLLRLANGEFDVPPPEPWHP
jgi:predicted transcriptional regulator